MQLVDAIEEFVTGYFSTHERSKKTRVAYHTDLKQFARFAGAKATLDSLQPTLIETWAAHLREREYSPASMRRKIVVLKVFSSYWLRKGVITESPFWRVQLSLGRIRQLPRALTEVEMRKLLDQAGRDGLSQVSRKGSVIAGHSQSRASSRSYRTLRNLALIDLLFATGMRVGEVSRLDTSDYVLTESSFRVSGKGGRDRIAFVVDEDSVRIQQAHLEARCKIISDSSALFLNASANRLSTQGIANVIAEFRKDAGIDRRITPHMLRHTVATLLLRNGADIRVVQEFLGHASIATTQRYTHVAKEHLISALKKHHPSLGFRTSA